MMVGSIQTDPPQPTSEAFSKLVLWPNNALALYLFGVSQIVPGSDPPLLALVVDGDFFATLLDGHGQADPVLNEIPFVPLGSPAGGDYVAVVPSDFDAPIAGAYTLNIFGGVSTPSDLNLSIPVEVVAREDAGSIAAPVPAQPTPTPLPPVPPNYDSGLQQMPATLTTITTATTRVRTLFLSNVSNEQHTVVVIQDGTGGRYVVDLSLAAGEVVSLNLGWQKFVNGIQVQADAPNVINFQITGAQ